MIRPLRQRHLQAALVLAVLLPVIVILALAARSDSPREPIPAELLDVSR